MAIVNVHGHHSIAWTLRGQMNIIFVSLEDRKVKGPIRMLDSVILVFCRFDSLSNKRACVCFGVLVTTSPVITVTDHGRSWTDS
jgi:hypothetical protein